MGCFNVVRIDGEKENLERVLDILRKAEVEEKFFDLVYPIPDELRNEEERFGDEWRADHWGSHLDIKIEMKSVHKRTEKTILLMFDTEWSPPIPFLEKFAKDFQVDIEIRYVAEKNKFIGKAVCKGGKLISHESIDNPTQLDLQRQDLDFSRII